VLGRERKGHEEDSGRFSFFLITLSEMAVYYTRQKLSTLSEMVVYFFCRGPASAPLTPTPTPSTGTPSAPPDPPRVPRLSHAPPMRERVEQRRDMMASMMLDRRESLSAASSPRTLTRSRRKVPPRKLEVPRARDAHALLRLCMLRMQLH
jgi:hypothetical protein